MPRGALPVTPSILVLLAEDDPLIAAAVADDLEEAAFAVRVAANGQEAIALLDGEEAFSAIVTDIRLGEGPDGWKVARHGRERNHYIPVVYMTGDSAHDHAVYGVPDSIMLQKPFVAAQLITAVTTLMNAVPPPA